MDQQEISQFFQPHSKLLTDLDSNNIDIAATQGLVEELNQELVKLKVSSLCKKFLMLLKMKSVILSQNFDCL